jgi:hypothetical protein
MSTVQLTATYIFTSLLNLQQCAIYDDAATYISFKVYTLT